MEIGNPGFILDVAADEFPLIDPLLEEVGEIKLEIHRVKNRINVIKSFYEHMRNSTNHVVRRELEDKVNDDVDIIMSSLSKVQSTLNRWAAHKEGRKEAELPKIKEYMRQVIADYEEILNDHRTANIKELKYLLKAASQEDDDGKSMLAVNQNYLRALNEQNHIEIEERYAELLRTDIALRNLRTKFSHVIASKDQNEYAVLQLSQFIDQNTHYDEPKTTSTFFKAALLATLLGLSCFFIIIMLYILL